MQLQMDDFSEAGLFKLFEEKSVLVVTTAARDALIHKANELMELVKRIESERPLTPEEQSIFQRQALGLRTDLSLMQVYVDVAMAFENIKDGSGHSLN